MSLIGGEGMVGLSVVMGNDVSQNHAIVQIADGAMRVSAGALRAELKRTSTGRGRLRRSA